MHTSPGPPKRIDRVGSNIVYGTANQEKVTDVLWISPRESDFQCKARARFSRPVVMNRLKPSLSRISSGDVVFQFFNMLGLAGDGPLHQIAE
jgi:hypothetical protein